IAEALLHKKRPALWWWLGMAIALPCAAWLTTSTDASPTWQGDALAALAGVAGAVYFMLGRDVRGRVGIATYGSLVCASAAAVLLPVSLSLSVPLIGFSPGIWLGIAALAIGPQLLGHNGFNYALRYLPASVVTAASLLEPIGAGLLAWVFLSEPLTPLTLVAGLGSVVGVGLATLGPTLRPRLSKRQLDP
ncbi:MAG: DMT family transporter, partial [Myxococcota bacterium]